ncbi:MAG: hypothetical protein L6V93_09565 [Clostridiales bacterium]|nr:MAG: hypothetical protein L6V93_09565 [Clostridiales bacterium]
MFKKSFTHLGFMLGTRFFSNVFAVSDTDVPILFVSQHCGKLQCRGQSSAHHARTVLKEHMQALNNAGYTSISYKDYQNYVKGLGEIPEKKHYRCF